MKKILSVMLAIMMLFGALSISASASNDIIFKDWYSNNTTIEIDSKTYEKSDYVIVSLNFNNCTSFNEFPVYNTTIGEFEMTQKATGTILLLPGAPEYTLLPGEYITLPRVTPEDGKQFICWHCEETGEDIAGGKTWKIPEGSGGMIYHFIAETGSAEAEGDTLNMILGVLTKVFGTILGILFLDGNSAAGVELVEKLLGGLL